METSCCGLLISAHSPSTLPRALPDVFLNSSLFCSSALFSSRFRHWPPFHQQLLTWETSFEFLSSARSSFFARYFLFLNFCLFWSRASFSSMCVSSGLMFCFLNDILHVSLGGLHVGLSSNIVFPFPLLWFFYIKCYMNFGPSSLLSALWIWYLANLLHRISVAIRVLWKGFWYKGDKTLNYTK